jgi:uncharacterized protein YkwD
MRRLGPSPHSVVVSVLMVLLMTAGLVAAGAGAAPYSASSYAERLLSLVNDVRELHGLPPLAVATGTTTVAAGWTEHLADARTLSHNPQLAHQLASHGSSRWLAYGENVGVGAAGDPNGLFTAYMNSPEHRANILDRAYRYVGVAVVTTGSRAWNTFDFVDIYGAMSAGRHRRVA